MRRRLGPASGGVVGDLRSITAFMIVTAVTLSVLISPINAQLKPKPNPRVAPAPTSCPTATSAIFLRLEGVVGESNDPCHKGEVELLSEEYSGSGFTIVKRIDTTTPKLLMSCVGGVHIPLAVITLVTAGSPQQLITYKLKDVGAASWYMSATSDTQEQVVLKFASLETQIVPSAISVQATPRPSSVQALLNLRLPAPPRGPGIPAHTVPGQDVPARQAAPYVPYNVAVYNVSGGVPTCAANRGAQFQVSKPIDSASAYLQQAYMSQNTLSEVVLTIKRNPGSLKFTLGGVRVSSDTQSAGAQQLEQVGFSFSRWRIDWSSQ